jgi:hypothetical protein
MERQGKPSPLRARGSSEPEALRGEGKALHHVGCRAMP